VIGDGWNAIAWRLPDRSGDWTLRVPRLEDALPEMEAQNCLGPKLHAPGFPVPEGWRLLRDSDGRIAAGLYRYVDGERSRAKGLREHRELARQIAAFLTALHALDPEIARSCGSQVVEPWVIHFRPMVERHAAGLAPRSRAWIQSIADRLAVASEVGHPMRLTHADLKPEHLIVDAAGMVRAVLDFEGPCVTDPAMDFARVIQFWGEGFTRMVLRDYRGAPDDDLLLVRARCYYHLELIHTLHTALERESDEWRKWAPWARRQIAVRAAAATRRARSGGSRID
jgi:aminoglycoside phosphotransferase (APT) family kinase protein